MSLNIVIAGLDQDWAQATDYWDRLTPRERGEIAEWLCDRRGCLDQAPDWTRQTIGYFAKVACLETALRWAQQREER